MPDKDRKVIISLMVRRKYRRRGRVGFTDSYDVTGTRHAYYLLRKLAQNDWFDLATLITFVSDGEGDSVNKMQFTQNDIITESAKFASLLDRKNIAYEVLPSMEKNPSRSLCAPTGACQQPQFHTSMNCYPRYCEMEYEGPGTEQKIMTYTEWRRNSE